MHPPYGGGIDNHRETSSLTHLIIQRGTIFGQRHLLQRLGNALLKPFLAWLAFTKVFKRIKQIGGDRLGRFFEGSGRKLLTLIEPAHSCVAHHDGRG
jgi:hypothetical protein